MNPRHSRRWLWDTALEFGRTIALVWSIHPGYTLVISILTVLQGTLPVLQAWISKLTIDSVAESVKTSGPGLLPHILTLVVCQAGILLAQFLMVYVQDSARSLLGELTCNQINLQILEKANGLDVAAFENEQFLNKLQNAHQEAGHRPLEIVSQLLSIVQMTVTLASASILLLRLHWATLPLIIVPTIPVLLLQNSLGYRTYWMLRERAPEVRKQRYLGFLMTSQQFVKEIRVFGLERYLLELCRSLFAKFFRESRALVLKYNAANALASIVSVTCWLLMAGYIVRRITTQQATIGDFVLYTQVVTTAQMNVSNLLSTLSRLYSNSLFLHNLYEFLAFPGRNLQGDKVWSGPIEDLELRNVCFRYPGTQRMVLENINLKIHKGRSLAVVGKNGAGKTTLIKILCRLYEPTSGRILINGMDITEFSPRSVQDEIAVLFQDFGQYYLTARDNIRLGQVARPVDGTAIAAAAMKSGAHPVIDGLPRRYDTPLGKWFDDGVDLSGGEWQKVALARAFYRRGSVLILDEPTSSLDPEAEYGVFKDLTSDGKDRMLFLVSHRFSTVRAADDILVLEEGRCVESGSHLDLLASGGHYARLFYLQAQGYRSDEGVGADLVT